MRGSDRRSGELLSYVDVEARVRRDHPLRAIRALANEALEALSSDFAALYQQLQWRRIRRLFNVGPFQLPPPCIYLMPATPIRREAGNLCSALLFLKKEIIICLSLKMLSA